MKKKVDSMLDSLVGELLLERPVHKPVYSKEIESIKMIDVTRVSPNINQPRKKFDKESIRDLASSLKENGIIQPLVVRPNGSNGFEIIAGERRYRAALVAGLQQVPVIIKNWSDQKTAIAALVENIQREDLGPIEKAEAFAILIQEYGWKQQELADRLGIPRSQVANILRLLKTSEEVKEALRQGLITEGHAKVLAAVSLDRQAILVAQIQKHNWSVRKLEQVLTEPVRKIHETKKQPNSKKDEVDYMQRIESLMSEAVLVPVSIKKDRANGGMLVFHYHSNDGLIDLIQRLSLSHVLKQM